MMKGKKVFTQNEANQILDLIEMKLKAPKEEQKRIRDKIRAIGFYYTDFDNRKIPGGYTQRDFLRLTSIQK